MRPAVVALIAVGSLLAAVPSAQQAAPAVVVYEGALVIPGNGSGPITNAAFLLQNGTIASVGPRGAVAVPGGAARVDLYGQARDASAHQRPRPSGLSARTDVQAARTTRARRTSSVSTAPR